MHALKQPRIRRSLTVRLISAITDAFPSSGHRAAKRRMLQPVFMERRDSIEMARMQTSRRYEEKCRHWLHQLAECTADDGRYRLHPVLEDHHLLVGLPHLLVVIGSRGLPSTV